MKKKSYAVTATKNFHLRRSISMKHTVVEILRNAKYALR